MKRISLLLLFAGLIPSVLCAQNRYDRLFELDQWTSPGSLPTYRPGVVEQISSYDPTGGNEDGFAGKYSYLRKEGEKLVLADLKGPGVINRIWTPTPTRDTLEFFFDGEREARLKICFSDLFNGKVYHLVYPLCGNAVGGYYCYFPIPYKESCKVLFSGKRIQFHQIQYRNLPDCELSSFDTHLTEEERASVDRLCKVWSNLDPRMSDYESGCKMVERSFFINPGEETVFFKKRGGGRICGFEIEAGDALEGFYKDLILKAVWDDDKAYAIQAPVADYFGYAFGRPAMRSILIGSSRGRNYSYLPAPFDKRAKMALRYEKRDSVRQMPVPVTTRVYYRDEARDAATEGRLYTSWRREIHPKDGEYYKFLRHRGRGHYVGTIHQAQGFRAEMTQFFEGDDSTYVDGKMRIHGTGSEDYYNGGWYAMLDRWDRGFSMPLHGCLDYSLPMARTGGYRFYMGDKLSFSQDFYMGIEHGPVGNRYPVDYTSVAFFYGESPDDEQMVPEERLRTVYPPSNHTYYPQAMRLSVGNNVRTTFGDYPRGIVCSSRGSGLIRVLLEDVPEGRYRVFVDYYTKSNGAEFSVWHRQVMLKDWISSEGEQDRKVEKYDCGEIDLTPQCNSVSFQIRGDQYRREFEFANIYLVRCTD